MDIFIQGAIDTVWDGIKVKAINPAQLANGFELTCPDSSVKILGFEGTFDNKKDGKLYAFSSKGNKAIGDAKQTFSLLKIKDATLIAIDNITFRYKNICYKFRSQIYLCR